METPVNYYSRKQFIKLSAGAALVALVRYDDVIAGGGSGRPPLNPREREAYTLHLLDKLCTAIGPRPTGSTAYEIGAQIIREELQKSLSSVAYDYYHFNKWELISEARFEIDHQLIETYLAFGSQGTPEGGVSGVLIPSESGFAVVHTHTQKIEAYLAVNKYGRAIPTDRSLADPTEPPFFGIGKQDVVSLEKAVINQSLVRLKAPVRFSTNGKGINVIGQLPGKQKDEILFLAHADTMYSTPGAIDNTASVIVMIMLAHEAAKRGIHKHTLTFAATDGEEYGLLGAKNYARIRIKEDTMKNIRYIINFDSLTWGPNLWINSLNDEVKDILRSVHHDLGIKSYPRFESSDGFSMDSAPFRPSEGRALHVNSRGYDEQTLPLYHRPDDQTANVPLDCVESAFQLFNEFIQRIDKL